MKRIILHIDMNAYFASCAQLANPDLRGKPVAVGGKSSKSIISTASYEARKYGVRSAMPVFMAKKLCPELILVDSDFKLYEKYTRAFVSIIKRYSYKIEMASIDECYVDMSEELINNPDPLKIIKEIQDKIYYELGLPCSIGVAPNKFLAKMASDMKKPLGLTILRKRDVKDILFPLSVKEIFGIGKKTYPKLIDHGIITIADFMNPNNRDVIIDLIGENHYYHSFNSISGSSTNIVDPNRYSDPESISTSATFDVPLTTIAEILFELRRMTREVIVKLNRDDYLAKTVGITLRDSDFNTITRRKTIDEYSNDFIVIYEFVTELVEYYFDSDKTYRLVGMSVSNLVKKGDLPKEYNLFTIDDINEKEEIVSRLINDFQSKYGEKILFRRKK